MSSAHVNTVGEVFSYAFVDSLEGPGHVNTFLERADTETNMCKLTLGNIVYSIYYVLRVRLHDYGQNHNRDYFDQN